MTNFIRGKICKRHPEVKGERYAKSRLCVECQREFWREYRQLPEWKAGHRGRRARRMQDPAYRTRMSKRRRQQRAKQKIKRENEL